MKYYFVNDEFKQYEGNEKNAPKIIDIVKNGKLRVVIVQQDSGDELFGPANSFIHFFKYKYTDTKEKYPLIIIYNVNWIQIKKKLGGLLDDESEIGSYAENLMAQLGGFGYYAQTALIGSPEFMNNENNRKCLEIINKRLREGLKKRFLYFFTRKQKQEGKGFKPPLSGLKGRPSGEGESDGESEGEGEGEGEEDYGGIMSVMEEGS